MFSEKKINKYFELAKNASKFSDFHKQSIGAVVIDKNHVLSVGWNTQKTSTMQKNYNRLVGKFDTDRFPNCMHAEMSALQKLPKKEQYDYSKCHIFIYRESGGLLRLAKPCKACEKALRDMGIVNIHYTGLNSLVYEKYIEEK